MNKEIVIKKLKKYGFMLLLLGVFILAMKGAVNIYMDNTVCEYNETIGLYSNGSYYFTMNELKFLVNHSRGFNDNTFYPSEYQWFGNCSLTLNLDGS